MRLSELTGPEQQPEIEAEVLLMMSSLTSSVRSMLTKNVSSQKLDSAISSLARLYHFHIKINSLLWNRKVNENHEPHIKFSLGKIVKHKIYGFRVSILKLDTLTIRNFARS